MATKIVKTCFSCLQLLCCMGSGPAWSNLKSRPFKQKLSVCVIAYWRCFTEKF